MFSGRRDQPARAVANMGDVAARRRNADVRYNVVRWAEMPRGGHFAALEQPELWFEDVRAFFKESLRAPQ